MPVLFICPHCQTSTQVDDCYSGHTGECVTCGKAIQIPEFKPSEIADPPRQKSLGLAWVTAVVVVILLVGLIVFLVRVGGQTVQRMSATRGRSDSVENLRRIAEALNAYANDNGTYPPSVLKIGSRRHSWRVLILPYLGEDDLYSRYNFDEAWDSPRNMGLIYQMPRVFQNSQVSAPYSVTSRSHYYLITGAGTVFPPSGPLSPDQIKDEHEKTLLVVEGSPVNKGSGSWTEPCDLQIQDIQASSAVNGANGLGGLLDGGFAAATVDAMGHFIDESISPIALDALITANGGERLPDDVFD